MEDVGDETPLCEMIPMDDLCDIGIANDFCFFTKDQRMFDFHAENPRLHGKGKELKTLIKQLRPSRRSHGKGKELKTLIKEDELKSKLLEVTKKRLGITKKIGKNLRLIDDDYMHVLPSQQCKKTIKKISSSQEYDDIIKNNNNSQKAAIISSSRVMNEDEIKIKLEITKKRLREGYQRVEQVKKKICLIDVHALPSSPQMGCNGDALVKKRRRVVNGVLRISC